MTKALLFCASFTFLALTLSGCGGGGSDDTTTTTTTTPGTPAFPAACSDIVGGEFTSIFADMHDGDKKEITINGSMVTIKPSGNNESWVIYSKLDDSTCTVNVDFNVTGKPSPPPVNLTATIWLATPANVQQPSKIEVSFSDPSGTLPAGPLNLWVQINGSAPKGSAPTCPTNFTEIYADMHDGDMKEVTIQGTSMTIKPSGNNQTWIVNAQVDATSCSAVVDFNVTGKPSPPPVNLSATFWSDSRAPVGAGAKLTQFVFTDPSGTLAAKDFPLNVWLGVAPGPAPGPTPAPTPKPTPGPTPAPTPAPNSTCNATLLTSKNCDNDFNLGEPKSVTSTDECCNYCIATANCTAWTWNANISADPNRTCYLKKNCDEPADKEGCISGLMANSTANAKITLITV